MYSFCKCSYRHQQFLAVLLKQTENEPNSYEQSVTKSQNGAEKLLSNFTEIVNGAVMKSKKSVGWTIDIFGLNKKTYTVMKVINYRFIK